MMIAHTRMEPGPDFSEGARRLWLAKAERKASVRTLAKLLRVSRSHLNHLLNGTKPLKDRELAIRIEDELGIEPRLFDQPPKREFVLPAARAARHSSPGRSSSPPPK